MKIFGNNVSNLVKYLFWEFSSLNRPLCWWWWYWRKWISSQASMNSIQCIVVDANMNLRWLLLGVAESVGSKIVPRNAFFAFSRTNYSFVTTHNEQKDVYTENMLHCFERRMFAYHILNSFVFLRFFQSMFYSVVVICGGKSFRNFFVLCFFEWSSSREDFEGLQVSSCWLWWLWACPRLQVARFSKLFRLFPTFDSKALSKLFILFPIMFYFESFIKAFSFFPTFDSKAHQNFQILVSISCQKLYQSFLYFYSCFKRLLSLILI